jgi:hypothetical protein
MWPRSPCMLQGVVFSHFFSFHSSCVCSMTQVHMFENPYHRRQLYAWGLTPETAFTCAFM